MDLCLQNIERKDKTLLFIYSCEKENFDEAILDNKANPQNSILGTREPYVVFIDGFKRIVSPWLPTGYSGWGECI